MIPATVAAPLYFRPIGTDLYEVVRHGTATGRVRWTGTGFDSYTLTGELIATDAAVMTAAAAALAVASVEKYLAGKPTTRARIADAALLRELGQDEAAELIEATIPALTPTNPVAVSRLLRRAGFLPAPAGREGVRVTRGLPGTASVAVSFVGLPTREARMAADAREVLTEAGYVVEVNPHASNLFTVKGRRA